jgi:hypothetical protein
MRGHGLRIFDKIRVDNAAGKLSDDATLAADPAREELLDVLRAGPSGARVSGVEDQGPAPNVAALDPFGILK